MPRTRDIRPGFFKNEDLAQCEPLARILFQGLWTLADREGRLEDRPLKIKVEVLPYDNCDIEALLNQLAKFGFIYRYEAEGKKCIWVSGFKGNQRVHPKEPDSVLPEYSRDLPRQNAEIPGNSAAKNAIPSIPTIPTLPSIPPTPKGGSIKKATQKTLVDDNWQPSENFHQWLREKYPATTPLELQKELERFKSYCKANGKKYADHDAAMRNWFDSPYRVNKALSPPKQQTGLSLGRPAIVPHTERKGGVLEL